ncbi:helix-turn-helix transcriptional regulator [Streptomyces formicae]|uniref:Putative transcriptional regulator n=1 Tax=Streptomyces formicae TaxID=1616117 RepID=A0A291Q412_9ACTN|nr:AAA family ATPase [Streptomyces formicae]ATL26237.1 putative transcriptional regulator [Streptomyces formicae]
MCQFTTILENLEETGGLVVELAGDPGTGKTRMLTRFADEARRQGYQVLRTGCTTVTQNHPFRALAQLLHTNPADYSDTQSDELVTLLRDLAAAPSRDVPDSPPHTPGGSRCLMLHRVRHLLQGRAKTGLVLLIDDLQWADPGTLEVVDYLLSWPVTAPLLLVAAHRPRQSALRLQDALGHAVGLGTARRIDLPPLTLAESAHLTGLPEDGPDLLALHQESRGNPLYLRALAESAQQPVDAVFDAQGLPPGWFSSRLLAELAQLTPDETSIISAAAMLGDRFALEDLTEVAAMDPDRACRASARLSERDLFRPAGPGLQLTFRHPLMRQVVFADLDHCWRRTARGHVVTMRSRAGTPAVELAPLLEEVPPTSGDEDRHVLAQAAVEIMATDPDTACRWIRIALRAVPEGGEYSAERVELLTALARAQGLADAPQGALEVSDEMLALVPAEPRAPRVRMVVYTALLDCSLGRHGRADELLGAELRRVGDPDTDEEAALAASLTVARELVACVSGTLPDAEQLRAAVRWARRGGDRADELGALSLLAARQVTLGQSAQAEAAVDACAGAADSLIDAELAAHPEYLGVLGWAECMLGRPAEAESHLQRGVRLAERSHETHLLPTLLNQLATVRYQSGRFVEAREAAASAQRVAPRTGSSHAVRLAATLEAVAAAQTTHDVRAARRAAELSEALMPVPLGPLSRDGHWHVSAALWLADAVRDCVHPAQWSTTAIAAFGGPQLPRVPASLRPLACELLAEAAARAGRPDPTWADRAEAVARPSSPAHRAHALAARAHVLTGPDAARQAADRYQEAARLFASAGMTGQQARTLLLAAPRLAEAGHPLRALALLERADELAEWCGSLALRKRIVQQRLRLPKARPQQRPPVSPPDAVTGASRVPTATPAVASPASGTGRAVAAARVPVTPLTPLTDRERQVAVIAGTGKRTREIAEQLRLSPRTIDVHLTRIYRKLGINSRAALVHFMAETG